MPGFSSTSSRVSCPRSIFNAILRTTGQPTKSHDRQAGLSTTTRQKPHCPSLSKQSEAQPMLRCDREELSQPDLEDTVASQNVRTQRRREDCPIGATKNTTNKRRSSSRKRSGALSRSTYLSKRRRSTAKPTSVQNKCGRRRIIRVSEPCIASNNECCAFA